MNLKELWYNVVTCRCRTVKPGTIYVSRTNPNVEAMVDHVGGRIVYYTLNQNKGAIYTMKKHEFVARFKVRVKWVIHDRFVDRYFAGFGKGDAEKWEDSIDNAKLYNSESEANQAVSLLNYGFPNCDYAVYPVETYETEHK